VSVGVAPMGRLVAKLYTRRREAIERNVPFWPSGEAAGQDGRAGGQDALAAKLLKTAAGQDGQVGQDRKVGAGGGTPPRGESVAMARAEEVHRPAFPAHGPQNRPDHPDRPDRSSDGAGSSRSGPPSPAVTVLTARHPWTDDRAWILEVTRAPTRDAQVAALSAWVAAAGGRLDGGVAELPPLRPRRERRLAELELRRLLRRFGVEPRGEVERAEGAAAVSGRSGERSALPDAFIHRGKRRPDEP
jgi:hypothetical protein